MNHTIIENIKNMYEARGYCDIEVLTLQDGSTAVIADNNVFDKDGKSIPIDHGKSSKILTIPAFDPKLAEKNPDKAWKLDIQACKRALHIFTSGEEVPEIGLGIILHSSTTATAKSALAKANEGEDISLQLFEYKRFGYNLLDHKYQPSFSVVKGKELEDFRKKFPDTTKLPRLATKDPIVKHFRFKPGKIIRINRPSGAVSYRIVYGPSVM